MTSFLIPWPPSTNSLWRAIGGRNILSARYRAWMDEAGAAVVSQNPDTFIGPVTVTISYGAPTKRPFDLDNVIKAPLDLIKSLGIIEDDNCHIVKKLTVAVDPEICGAMVTVEAA